MITLLLAVIIMLSGCVASAKVEQINTDGWLDVKGADKPGYGEYSDEIDEAMSHSGIYLAYVVTSFNESDGVALKSFKLDEQAEKYFVNGIEPLNNIPPDLTNEKTIKDSLILSKIIEPALRIKLKIAKRDISFAAGNTDNEKWFEELRDEILDAKEVYVSGSYFD